MSGGGVVQVQRSVHSTGRTDVCFGGGALLLSGGQDNQLCLTGVSSFDNGDIVSVEHHTAGVTCVAANERTVVSGDDHGNVNAFTLPKLAFETTVVRSMLTVDHLALDVSGTFVAVASENAIKVVNVHDITQMYVIQGEKKGLIRSVAFDPKQQYLAVNYDDGNVRIWTYGDERKCVATVQVFTQLAADEANLCRLTWHPSGDRIAVGGGKEVAVIDRATWSVTTTLKNEHKEPVSLVAWSPSGHYIATCDMAGVAIIWQWNNKEATAECIDKHKHASRITGIAWSPVDNFIALADDLGFITAWKDVITVSSKHPHPAVSASSIAAAASSKNSGMPGFDEDDDEDDEKKKKKQQTKADQGAEEADEDEILVRKDKPRKLLVKKRKLAKVVVEEDEDNGNEEEKVVKKTKPVKEERQAEEEDDEEEMDGGVDIEDEDEDEDAGEEGQDAEDEVENKEPTDARRSSLRKKASVITFDYDSDTSSVADRKEKRKPDTHVAVVGSGAAAPTKRQRQEYDEVYEGGDELDMLMQPPFQPSSTEDTETKKRRYLVWNMVGIVTTQKDVGHNNVNVEFHDKGRYRPIQNIDYFQMSMAALGEHGVIMACQRHEGAEVVPSTLSVTLFDNWASNCNWQVQMDPHENIDAIAVGKGWFACATDQLYVRLFSASGIQTFIFSLAGRCVAMVGNEDLLFLVFHRAVPPVGGQFLDYMLLDATQRKILHQGQLALHPEAKLDWIGFSDTNMPVTFDSQGVLRGLISAMQYTWTPLLDTRMPPLESDRLHDYYWPVGVTEQELLCVVCKGGSREPAIMPRPVIATIPLTLPPLTGQDSQLSDLCMQSYLNTEKAKAKAFQRGESIEDVQDDAELKAFTQEMDKQLLKIIMTACAKDKDMRALDVCNLLSGPKSMEAAIQIAMRKKRSNLVERMNLIKKAKEEQLRLLKQAKLDKFSSSFMSAPSLSSSSSSSSFASKPAAKPVVLVDPMDIDVPALPVRAAAAAAAAATPPVDTDAIPAPTAEQKSPIKPRAPAAAKAPSPAKSEVTRNPFARSKPSADASASTTPSNPFAKK